jgi:hypothetical protein
MAFLTAFMLSAVTAGHAWGWGALGHKVTARIAEKHLTAEAKAAIKKLLEKDEDLAKASTWPDEHSREISGSASWHFVNVPIDEARYDAKFCAASGCVVSKLTEYQNVLANRSHSVAKRREALRIVVHLTGDLHQPLHVGDNHDRGGNDTQV